MGRTSKAAGWAVAVWTARMGGGEPMLVLYAARFSEKVDAISLVQERFASYPDDKIGDAYPLSKVTLDAIGMEPGECIML